MILQEAVFFDASLSEYFDIKNRCAMTINNHIDKITINITIHGQT